MLFKELNKKCGLICDFRKANSALSRWFSRSRCIRSFKNQSTVNFNTELKNKNDKLVKMVLKKYEPKPTTLAFIRISTYCLKTIATPYLPKPYIIRAVTTAMANSP